MTRALIGLVPQELSGDPDAFENRVAATGAFSRGTASAKKADPGLHRVKCWRVLTAMGYAVTRESWCLSGGMKASGDDRQGPVRMLPRHSCFLVRAVRPRGCKLANDMWQLVRALRDSCV
jgi:hypothetical protein